MSEPVLVPKKKVTIKKHKLALKQAKEKINRVLTGEPRKIKSKASASNQNFPPGSAPQRGKSIQEDREKLREQVKEARVSGIPRDRASARYGIPVETIRTWEKKYKWPTKEAIIVEAHRMKLEMAGIKPATRKGKKVISNRVDAILNTEKANQSMEVIREKALTLVQVGEENAERVAKSVSELIKTSLEALSIRPPSDLTELSTAFKMVEQATGRNKPQAVSVQLGVSVSPHMSSIIGDIRPGTVTLDAEVIEDVSPTWLSSQSTDDSDLGL